MTDLPQEALTDALLAWHQSPSPPFVYGEDGEIIGGAFVAALKAAAPHIAAAERERFATEIRGSVVYLAGLACGMKKVTGASDSEWERWTRCIDQAATELAAALPENSDLPDGDD